ncbi:MAG: glycosyltransferase [Acidimicrobiales bacterium]|nr:glycosyltransferase [Acidimicrobiales bacterium]
MTWQWVVHLAEAGVKITALINRSDPTAPIDPRTAELPPSVEAEFVPHFVSVEPPRLSRRLPVNVYTAIDYQGWQRRALACARELHVTQPFDLVHHLSWASIHHGTQLVKLDAPFVLGPVGGGTMSAPGYSTCFPNSWRYEQVRNRLVQAVRFNPVSRSLVKNADLILASNAETRSVLASMGAGDVQIMLDDGVDPLELQPEPVDQSESGPLRVLWVGRIMERKALGMALDAVRLASESVDIRMTLMGDGENRHVVADTIEKMVDDGTLIDHGWSDQQMLDAAFASHDVLLFNSVRDNGGAPLHSASTYGLPAVVINHQGPGAITSPDWAIQVKPSTTEQSTVDIAGALVALARDRDRRVRMGWASLHAGAANTWPARARSMAERYRAVVR